MKAPERLPSSDIGRPATALGVEIRTDGAHLLEVRLQGEIDIVTIPALDEALSAALDGHSGNVVVDLADVDFIGVGGLEALCSQARRLRQRGGQLTVSSPSALTLRVIHILGVAEFLSLSPQEAQRR